MTQYIALNVLCSVIFAAVLAASVRYFSFSKRADDEPLDRARLIYGKMHPDVLIRTLLAAGITWSSWIVSNELVAHGYRIFAGMTLALAAPAAITLGSTLFALMLIAAVKPGPPQERLPPVVMLKHKIAMTIIFAAIIVGFALLPIFR